MFKTKDANAQNHAHKIAYAIRELINENNKANQHLFDPEWETRSEKLSELTDNICDLYAHPQKNKELLYFLNKLANSYYQ
ncbi:hypothetical protein [Anaerotignum lactatifermentans]|uniref:hypothetical protein n=1 Tax=Anaerotignum lactatifermentans TaxID=160404 RepID=UPI0017497B4C|nr:hypothetical protein [Anaerotignum lactatifermentans]